MKELRARGVRCIAAHPHTDKKFLSQADFSGDCCIVFGSEGDGIPPAVLEACDEAVAIPMPPAVDSLNVGAAAAVFLYEVARQQRGEGVTNYLRCVNLLRIALRHWASAFLNSSGVAKPQRTETR